MQFIILLPLFFIYTGSTFGASLESQVWLMNCIDKDTSRYSEIALYPDWPAGQPESIISIPTAYNSSAAWAYFDINQTLPDGRFFSVSDMSTQVAQKSYNAPAQLGKDDLFCATHVVENLYSKADGSTCSSAFQCAHPNVIENTVTTPHVDAVVPIHNAILNKPVVFDAADQTKITFIAYDDKHTLDGQLHPFDIFWSIWSQRDDSHFLGNEISFGPAVVTSWIPFKTGQCTIKFEGHGDIPWTTTNGLASTLLSVVQKPNFLTYTSNKVRTCSDTCARAGTCCRYDWETQWQTSIPARMDMQVVNVPPTGSGRNPSDQGELHYIIDCPVTTTSLGCEICKLLGLATQAAGMSEDVGAAFGGANVILSAVCGIAGCS
jgi:hypothetical protein